MRSAIRKKKIIVFFQALFNYACYQASRKGIQFWRLWTGYSYSWGRFGKYNRSFYVLFQCSGRVGMLKVCQMANRRQEKKEYLFSASPPKRRGSDEARSWKIKNKSVDIFLLMMIWSSMAVLYYNLFQHKTSKPSFKF